MALTIILLYFFFHQIIRHLIPTIIQVFVPLKMFFFSPNHAVRNTSLKYVTEFLSYLIVTIKCYTSFVCLSVCWLSLFLFFLFFSFFFCFASGNGSVMTYNVWLSNILELTTIVVLLQLIYLKFPKIYSSMESIIKEYLSTILFYRMMLHKTHN